MLCLYRFIGSVFDKRVIKGPIMKKKETFWQLLERLDRQAGDFNIHLSEANRYFDKAADKTRKILEKQEKDLHVTISKVKTALKKFKKEMDSEKEKSGKSTGSDKAAKY